jgi:hypothetical protein
MALVAFPYSATLSNIGIEIKQLSADDSGTPIDTAFSEITVKVRTLGINNYIAVGNPRNVNLRLTAAHQAYSWIAPNINGVFVPLYLKDLAVQGSIANGAGILEIAGVEIKESKGGI